jgi:hypothetical protein
MNEWGFSVWFNHRDFSHIFLMIAAWFFYLGARRIIQEHAPGGMT